MQELFDNMRTMNSGNADFGCTEAIAAGRVNVVLVLLIEDFTPTVSVHCMVAYSLSSVLSSKHLNQ